MPIFLFFSAITNFVFLVRVLKDLCTRSPVISGAPATAMLLSACAELCWVLPCFIQCLLIFVAGNDGLGDFSNNKSFG